MEVYQREQEKDTEAVEEEKCTMNEMEFFTGIHKALEELLWSYCEGPQQDQAAKEEHLS